VKQIITGFGSSETHILHLCMFIHHVFKFMSWKL